MFHLTQNKLEAAIADLDAAIALDPKDADTYEARGIAHVVGAEIRRGHGELQQGDRARSRMLRPPTPTAAASGPSRATCPAALADVEQALKLQPGSVAGLAIARQLCWAASANSTRRWPISNVLRKAMPDNTEVLLQIAALYQAAKQPDKAIVDVRPAARSRSEERGRLSRPGRRLSQPGQAGRGDRRLRSGARARTQEQRRAQQPGLGAGHFAREEPARRQAGHRAGQAGLRSHRVQAGPHLEHAGGRLCRDGRLRHGHHLVEESRRDGTDQLKAPAEQGTRKLPGQEAMARSDPSGNRRAGRNGCCPSERGSPRATTPRASKRGN